LSPDFTQINDVDSFSGVVEAMSTPNPARGLTFFAVKFQNYIAGQQTGTAAALFYRGCR
jgi:hypothetical protein